MPQQFSTFNFIALIAILLFSLMLIAAQPKGKFAAPAPPGINAITIQPNENIYVYGAGKVAQLSSAGAKYFHNDYLGTPRVETNINKNIVAQNNQYPFGEVLSKSGAEKYVFTGKGLDKTNLQYFGARFYDSATGRFTQVDPAGVGYAYAANNPLKFVDPTGVQHESSQKPSALGQFGRGLISSGKNTLMSLYILGYLMYGSNAPIEISTKASVHVAMSGGVGNAARQVGANIAKPFIQAANGDPYAIGELTGDVAIGALLGYGASRISRAADAARYAAEWQAYEASLAEKFRNLNKAIDELDALYKRAGAEAANEDLLTSVGIKYIDDLDELVNEMIENPVFRNELVGRIKNRFGTNVPQTIDEDEFLEIIDEAAGDIAKNSRVPNAGVSPQDMPPPAVQQAEDIAQRYFQIRDE